MSAHKKPRKHGEAAESSESTVAGETHKFSVGYLHAVPLINSSTMEPLVGLDTDEEVRQIRSILMYVQKPVWFSEVVATELNFINILATHPTILHYAGHGLRKNGRLAFESEQGGHNEVTMHELLKHKRDQGQLPKLVFLAACHSQDAGQQFVDAGVSHVIAIKRARKVQDKDAINFTKVFYSELLLHGHSVEASFVAANGRGNASDFILLPQEANSHTEILFPVSDQRNAETAIVGGLTETTPRRPVNDCSPSPPFFVNRRLDLYHIFRHLQSGERCVTISGGEGIGKTALLSHAAKHLEKRELFSHILNLDLTYSQEGGDSRGAYINGALHVALRNCEARGIKEKNEILKRAFVLLLEEALQRSRGSTSSGMQGFTEAETNSPFLRMQSIQITDLVALMNELANEASHALVDGIVVDAEGREFERMLEQSAKSTHEAHRRAHYTQGEKQWRRISAEDFEEWAQAVQTDARSQMHIRAPKFKGGMDIPNMDGVLTGHESAKDIEAEAKSIHEKWMEKQNGEACWRMWKTIPEDFEAWDRSLQPEERSKMWKFASKHPDYNVPDKIVPYERTNSTEILVQVSTGLQEALLDKAAREEHEEWREMQNGEACWRVWPIKESCEYEEWASRLGERKRSTMWRFAVKHHEFNFPDRRLPWPPVDSQGGETENAFHWIDVNQDFEFLPEYWKDMNRNFAKRHGRAEKLNEEPEIGTQETLRAFHWIDVNQPYEVLPEPFKELNRQIYVNQMNLIQEQGNDDEQLFHWVDWNSPYDLLPESVKSMNRDYARNKTIEELKKIRRQRKEQKALPLLVVVDSTDYFKVEIVNLANELFKRTDNVKFLCSCRTTLIEVSALEPFAASHEMIGTNMQTGTMADIRSLDHMTEKVVTLKPLIPIDSAELLLNLTPRDLALSDLAQGSVPTSFHSFLLSLARQKSVVALGGLPKAIKNFAPHLKNSSLGDLQEVAKALYEKHISQEAD